MAYLVRRLLENTSNTSFLRAGFMEHMPAERLLMSPMTLLRPARGARSAAADAFVNEPLGDFSQEAAREAMSEALKSVGAKLGETLPLVIGGRRIVAGATMDWFNPSHRRQMVARVSRARLADAEAALAAAHGAFPGWRDTSPARRAEVLRNAARIMRRRRYELSAWEVYECGKQWREADSDVAEAIDYCEYYARQMLALAAGSVTNVPGEENEHIHEPRGVAVVIAPWNFPLAILCGMTAAALVTGNTVIMKPAEQSSAVGYRLMEVCWRRPAYRRA